MKADHHFETRVIQATPLLDSISEITDTAPGKILSIIIPDKGVEFTIFIRSFLMGHDKERRFMIYVLHFKMECKLKKGRYLVIL